MENTSTKKYPITGNVLLHSQHLEDGVLFGIDNAELSYRSLENMFNTLKGHTIEGMNITTKVDGSPSVGCASDFNGKAFVVYKTALEKLVNPPKPKLNKKTNQYEEVPIDTSRVCYTEEDCDRLYGTDEDSKAPKMKALLRYAKSIGIPKGEIWQGDFMFQNRELKIKEIDGEERLCFHPNTIIYTIPTSDPLAQKMMDSEYCVIWHTKYTGSDFGDLHISFDVDASRLPSNDKFLSLDAKIKNIAGRITLTQEETDICGERLNKIKSNIELLKSNEAYTEICKNEDFRIYFSSFMNALIKSEKKIQFIENHVNLVIEWVNLKLDKELESLPLKYKTQKTIDTKTNEINEKREILNSLLDNQSGKEVLEIILETQKDMVFVKELFEDKFNLIPKKFTNYVRRISTGAEIPIGEEGFCISDIEGNMQKIVSRLKFSASNFDNDIEKGWNSDRRASRSLNSSEDMNKLNTIKESSEKGKTCSIAFCRMNPMTTAHMELVKQLEDHADKGGAFLYLSRTCDPKNTEDPLLNKNPLDVTTKIAYAQTFINENGYDVKVESSIIPFRALNKLWQEGYEVVNFLAGSDRIEDFKNSYLKYNGYIDPNPKKQINCYSFKELNFIKIGEDRDDASDGIKGMSASKMRRLACEGNFEEFRKGVPTKADDLAKQLYDDIRDKML